MSKLSHSGNADMDAIEQQGRALDEQESRRAHAEEARPEQLLASLERLGKDWRDLVREDADKGWTDYADGFVGCYFANNSDHTAVKIGDFDIGFHTSPKIEFPIRSWPQLESAIAKGRALLERERAKHALISKDERQIIKEAKKASLLKQLQELEA